MTLVIAVTGMATLGGTDTMTEAPGVQEAGQGVIEEGITIAAPVAMADSILSLPSSHLLHRQDRHPRSAGAIEQIEIGSSSQHSQPHGHERGMVRRIGGIRVRGRTAPARLRAIKRTGVESQYLIPW
jgi:hypothetical protein